VISLLANWYLTAAALSFEPKALVAFQKGLHCHNQREYECAIDEYRTALTLDGTLVSAAINLGVVYDELKDTPLALFYYNEAVRVAPHSFSALYNRGQFRQKQGHLELARADYQAALAIKKDASLFINLAGMEIQLFDENKSQDYLTSADGHLKEAARLKAQSPAYFFNRARIEERRNFPARARYLYEEAMRRFTPDSAEYKTCALRVERLGRALR